MTRMGQLRDLRLLQRELKPDQLAVDKFSCP